MYFKKYSKLERDQKYNEYIEKALDDPNTKYLTHEEIFNKLRENLKKMTKRVLTLLVIF